MRDILNIFLQTVFEIKIQEYAQFNNQSNSDKAWVPEIYADDGISFLNLRFENDVKMYGTQAYAEMNNITPEFENDVKMYGTQAKCQHPDLLRQFENDVKMYGTQASWLKKTFPPCLRMM